jgi:hypothetical protein
MQSPALLRSRSNASGLVPINAHGAVHFPTHPILESWSALSVPSMYINM